MYPINKLFATKIYEPTTYVRDRNDIISNSIIANRYANNASNVVQLIKKRDKSDSK